MSVKLFIITNLKVKLISGRYDMIIGKKNIYSPHSTAITENVDDSSKVINTK